MDWRDYWEKAQSNLRVARWAYDHGEYDPGVSRSYYAAFHAAIALLLAKTPYHRKGETWNHAAVQGALNQHLIRGQKVIDNRFRSLLPDLLLWRHTADYEAQKIGEKRAGRLLQMMQNFLAAVQAALGENP